LQTPINEVERGDRRAFGALKDLTRVRHHDWKRQRLTPRIEGPKRRAFFAVWKKEHPMTILASSRQSPTIASFPVLAVLCASLNWTSKSDGQQVKDEPATLQRAIKMVNLKGFTKLNAVSIFRDQPAACEYTSKSSFAAAKGYYQAELASRSWTEMKGLSSDTPQYYDRT
jgi:hypothetical protein